jgi:hypothetical protein
VRVVVASVLVVLAAGVLWLAGEEHRRNCIASGHATCSVLPWVSGERVARGRLDARGCEQVRLINAYDGRDGDTVPTPPECR